MKRHLLPVFCLALFVCLSSADSFAQAVKGANGTSFELKPFTSDSKQNKTSVTPQRTAVVQTLAVTNSKNYYFILKFDRTLDAQEQNAILTASNLKYVGYFNDNTYLLSSENTNNSLESVKQKLTLTDVKVVGISDVPALFKIQHPLLSFLKQGKDIPASDAPEGIYLHVYNQTDLAPLKKTLANNKISFSENSEAPNSLVVSILNADTLMQLAEMNYVSGLEVRKLPEPEFTGLDLPKIVNGNQIAVVNYDRKGPIGRGVYFGNYEPYGSTQEFQASFLGREVAGRISRQDDSHGTNVTQIVGASNNLEEHTDFGMAPGVVVVPMEDENIKYTERAESLYKAGIAPLVSSHSVGWGAGEVKYNTSAMEMDNAVYTLPSYMHCFSSGNSGNTSQIFNNMVFPDYQSLTGSIKTSKNLLTVGAHANIAEYASFSSFGPTSDGRMKPDICAEGTAGTSYASPGVAGLQAVLFETYTTTYNEPARSDVTKAVMLNTSVDMLAPGIDFKSGFGHINPRRAVQSIRQRNLEKDFTMPQGSFGLKEFPVNIPAGTGEARIMLYWHDYPGTANAERALVNDLDLEVVTPDGQVVLPWVLDGRPERVKDLPKHGRDSLNNVEQVTFQTPVAGQYLVRVKGKSVVRGPQKFVVTWDFMPISIIINSQPEGFKLLKGDKAMITWDLVTGGSIANKTTTIYYRNNSSEEFKSIGSVRGKLYFHWTVPITSANSSTAQFKVECDGMESVSGMCHIISRPANLLHLKSFCSSKAKLGWNQFGNFTGKYIIYAVTDKYMEPLDSIDAPETSLEVFAPAGRKFDKNTLFAIGLKDANTGALSLRSKPISPNLTSDFAPYPRFNSEYTICYGDTVKFGPGYPEGDIKFFRNGVQVETTDRILNISRDIPGSYFYRLGSEADCAWDSEPIQVNAFDININDTTYYGNYYWNGSVFKGGKLTSTPLYGPTASYYGKFKLSKLGFDSKVDLFALNQTHDKIPGYVGCKLTSASNTTLMKRKGFEPGKYTITLKKIQYKAQLQLTNSKTGEVIVNFLSPTNPTSEITIGADLYLDENTEARLEFMGSQCVIDFSLTEASRLASPPGKVTESLTAWVKADDVFYHENGSLDVVKNNVLQNAHLIPDRADAGVSVVKNGLNYNSTLEFTGKGGLKGLFETNYQGNTVSDFAVFKMNMPQANSEARILSVGKSNSVDSDTLISYVAFERIGSLLAGAKRNKVQVSSNNAVIGRWHSMMTQYKADSLYMTYKGDTVKRVKTQSANFDIDNLTLGTAFSTDLKSEMQGQIAEVLHFNRALNADESNRLHSYLALKYGLTLRRDYVNSAGATVYPKDDVFFTNIAGLSSDLAQSLVQKQSKSEESGAVLVGSLGAIASSNSDNTSAFTTDNTFLVWGNNGKSLTLNTQTNTSGRIWKLVASQNKQTLRLNFKKSSIPVMNDELLTLHLVVSTNSDLQSETVYPMQAYTAGDGEEYYFAEIPVERDVQYFSFGYRVRTGLKDVMNSMSSVSYDANNRQIRVTSAMNVNNIEIVSMSGVVLKNVKSNQETTYVSVSDLPSGAYLVRVLSSGNRSSNHKLIIR